MPFSGGVYSLPAGNPVVTGTTITTTWANATLSDISTALSTCLLKDGTQTVTANIPMSGFKFTGLNGGTTAGDSLRYEQLYNASGITLTGAVSMNGFHIYGLASGSGTGQAVNWNQTAPGILTATGDTLYASAANTPARLAIGSTSGLPLVTNAGATAPQWGFGNQAAATYYGGPASGAAATPSFLTFTGAVGAGMQFLGSKVLAASASMLTLSAQDFSWANQSLIQVRVVNATPLTDAQGMVCRISQTSGASYDATSTYQYGIQSFTGNNARDDVGGNTSAAPRFANNISGNAANGGVNGVIEIINPNSNSFRKSLNGNFSYTDSAGFFHTTNSAVSFTGNSSGISGFVLFPETGLWQTGATLYAWGLRIT